MSFFRGDLNLGVEVHLVGYDDAGELFASIFLFYACVPVVE